MILIILLGVAMIVAAIAALYLKNLVSAIVAAGIVSLFASVLYLILAAPDVAMTEAAIGAALSGAIFIFAIKRTQRFETEEEEKPGWWVRW